jgi:hypothetical protein
MVSIETVLADDTAWLNNFSVVIDAITDDCIDCNEVINPVNTVA